MPIKPYPNAGNKLRVFICHAKGDKQDARVLYDLITMAGAAPWLDEKDLVVGISWEEQIEQAVPASEACLVLLSKGSVTKEGYVQREINFALRYADEKPEGTPFILPLLLEDCNVPFRLQKHQYARRFEQVQNALELRALARGRSRLQRPRSKRFRECRSKLRQIPDENSTPTEGDRSLTRKSLIVSFLVMYSSLLTIWAGWEVCIRNAIEVQESNARPEPVFSEDFERITYLTQAWGPVEQLAFYNPNVIPVSEGIP
jgi:Ca2+/Na+ antiporter